MYAEKASGRHCEKEVNVSKKLEGKKTVGTLLLNR